jgi:hypothetical protein
MAKRDPYRITSPRIMCDCGPTYTDHSCTREYRAKCERRTIRRARHAGKREAHAATIDADWICYEHRDANGDCCFDWVDPIDEPCAVAMPVCSRSLATMADVLT